jgi:hypothetical protein
MSSCRETVQGDSEKLLHNSEWRLAVALTAKIYYDNKSNFNTLQGIRSEKVKKNHN